MIKTRWRLFGNLRKGMEKMDKKDEIMLVNQESLTEKIYIIRGQKVMLDFELAEIYGYETKRFNEQVKNNIEKFDEVQEEEDTYLMFLVKPESIC